MAPNLIGLADFPDDQTLIARGKYTTLSRARIAQVKRVQGICATMMTAVNHALRDCEKRPPEDVTVMEQLQVCMENLRDSRASLIAICTAQNELKAWE